MSDQIKQPFLFMGSPYIGKERLVNALAANWKEGKDALFSGRIAAYFKSVDRNLFNAASNAEKAYQNDPSKGDMIFWTWIYSQECETELFWLTRNYGDLDHVLRLLHDGGDSEFNRLLMLLMGQKLFHVYVKSAGVPEQVCENVKYAERCFNKESSGYRRSKTRTLLYTILIQRKRFVFDSKSFQDIPSFAAYLQTFADESKEKLQTKIKPLFLDEYNLEPTFEGWLMNLGFQHQVSLWNDRYQVGVRNIDRADEEAEPEPTALPQETLPEDFAATAYEFETKFGEMLQKYPDILDDSRKFTGMMKDLFPQNQLQAHLMDTLYKMDIVKAIRNARSLTDLFTLRFIKRLVADFGVKEAYAKWAVSVWCVCYGEKILKKDCSIAIDKISGL